MRATVCFRSLSRYVAFLFFLMLYYPSVSRSDVILDNSGAKDESNLGMDKVWYLYSSLGFVGQNYPQQIQDYMNDWGTGSESISISSDLIGLLWRVGNNQTLLGTIFHQDFVILNRTLTGHQLSVFQDSVSISVTRYFGEKIANSFFLRADLGPTSGDLLDSSNSVIVTKGLGFVADGGYAVPLGIRACLLINLTATINLVLGDAYINPGLNIGILY
jgi:hypothetical protein